MGKRSTVYNSIKTDEDWELVSKENKDLLNDYLKYCKATDKAPKTIYQYSEWIKCFLVWNLKFNNNTFFVNIKKRSFISFFQYCIEDLQYSSARISTLKSGISALANYIMRILDEEYENYRNPMLSMEPVRIQPVRPKTVLEDEQIQGFLDYCLEHDMLQEAVLLALLNASGIRKSEVVLLTMDDFTDDRICYNQFYKTKPIRTKGRGKNGKVLEKMVFVDLFKPYFLLWKEYRETNNIDSPWLFISRHKGEWCQATVSMMNSFAKRFSELFGLEIYLHSFRHKWVTSLEKQGVPQNIIKDLQGWQSIDMVQRYSDVTVDEKLGDYFGKDKENNNE